MDHTQTTQKKPVDPKEPKPVPGCSHCDNIAVERDRAQANGDGSRVTDCHVRMARHLSADHR